jgi:hypothetical protein
MQDRTTPARARQSAPRKPQSAHKPAARAGKPNAEQLDKDLRQITARVLESLKNPAAIPSNVILAALKSARQL